MPWFKFDDDAVDHPKVAGLSDKAFRWWVRGLSYSCRYLTDGVLPKVFWKQVPNGVRTELVHSRLWDWIDPHFLIHDYHHHQAKKEDVEYDKARNRQKAADYRARKRAERDGATGNVTGDALPRVTGNVPNPDNRLQITHTDNRQQSSSRPAALVMSPLAYERRKQQCAFVGARLEVPHVLHGELRKLLGGANAETDLQAWYHDLDAEIESSGEAIPNVFRWLKARFGAWAEAAHEPSIAERAARIEAMVAAGKSLS